MALRALGQSLRVVGLVGCLLVLVTPVWAQESLDEVPDFIIDPEGVHGYQESGMNLSEYENVNLATGNLTLNIPLATLTTDGGLSYSVGAFYNSKTAKSSFYRGVENFGLGWDMRPPRLRATVGCLNIRR